MNFWINSNSGDYIEENNGVYKLCLIPRWQELEDGRIHYLPYEIIEINKSQFDLLKGFVPIKEKKLHSRLNSKFRLRYTTTLSDGSRGNSIRVEVPDITEARNRRINLLF